MVKGYHAIELNTHPAVGHYIDACTRTSTRTDARAQHARSACACPLALTLTPLKVSIDGFTITDHVGHATTMFAQEPKGFTPKHLEQVRFKAAKRHKIVWQRKGTVRSGAFSALSY